MNTIIELFSSQKFISLVAAIILHHIKSCNLDIMLAQALNLSYNL